MFIPFNTFIVHTYLQHRSETFSEQLTINDVATAIGARSNGIKIYNKGEKFLSAIDSVTNTIPHSNEATKKLEEMEKHYNIILVQQVIF